MVAGDEAGEVTKLLQEIRSGNRQAEEDLIPLVYEELRRLARHHLRRERGDHTLQTTALINEAYLRLMGGNALQCIDRNHFFAVAATVMRRILVDYAKTRNALKRGSGARRVPLEEIQLGSDESWDQILALHQALTRLAAIHPRAARVVEMRFFGELQLEEIAAIEGVAKKTITRDLHFAQSWLYGEMFPEKPRAQERMSPGRSKSRLRE